MAQNIVFNSGGTQTPFEIINGIPSFKFNDSGYWYSSQQDANLVDLGGNCTIELWLYSKGITERDTVFEKAGTQYQSYQQEIAMTWEVNNDITWYSRYSPNYDYGHTGYLSLNSWNQIAIKMSTGKTTEARTGFYCINGSNWISNYTSRSDTAIVPAGRIRIETGYSGPVESGSIAIVRCYNRMLNDNEIKQNFKIFRDKFHI